VSPVETGQVQPYVRWVIAAYLRLPDTPQRARPQDLDLAAQLHRRAVPEAIIEAAFLLATFRRSDRPPEAVPLGPIRSLRYFLPIIEELLDQQPSAAYLAYLRDTVGRIVPPPPTDDDPKKDVFT